MELIQNQLAKLNQSNYDELLNLVDEISKFSEDKQTKCWEQLVKQEFLENQLNKVVSTSDSKLIEFIANSCKNVVCRKFFTKDFLIKHLLGLLDSTDYELVKQTCRSIGNISYENEMACTMITKNDGIIKIIQILKSDNFKDQSIEENMNLKKIIFGCLSNILNDRPEHQEIALNNDLIELIIKTLQMDNVDLKRDSILYNLVPLLFCFIDCESSIESIKNLKLISNLIDRLKELKIKQIQTINEMNEIDLDAIESIIDLIMQLSNNDNEIQLKLIEYGIIEILIEILDHELIEEEQILKTSSNLVVLLISYDSNDHYYNNGKDFAYSIAKNWLDTYIQQFEIKLIEDDCIEKENLMNQNSINHDHKLIDRDDFIHEKKKPKNLIKETNQLITSSLMIGNFSGNNENAISICKDGLIDRLIKVIELNEYYIIQLDCLSALRNLAIPEHNKKYFISNGLLTRLLKLNHSDSQLVIFKYLATLRLINDGQSEAAFELATNHKLIDKLTIWCNYDSCPSVKAEATRLLASLFKNLEKLNFNYDHLMNRQLLSSLFEMMNSEHLKMQNEAINGIGFLINKFQFNQIVNELLKEIFLSYSLNQLNDYMKNESNESNDFVHKFIQNILSVLSFAYLKYKLELNDQLYEVIERIKQKSNQSLTTIDILLKLKS